VNVTAFLASNLLAQFSRQIFVQILGLESKKVCGNLTVRSIWPSFYSGLSDLIKVEKRKAKKAMKAAKKTHWVQEALKGALKRRNSGSSSYNPTSWPS
jgi:hypothetical protein